MQLTKRTKNKKRFIIPLVIVGLMVAALGTYVLVARPFDKNDAPEGARPVNDVSYTPATETEKKDAERAKEAIVKQEQQPSQPATNGTIVISRASQTGTGQALNIRTIVEGFTTGECIATLTRSGQNVTKTGSITPDASSYTCSIDISASDFPAAGKWDLSIIAKSGTISSPAVTQEVTVNK